MGGTKKLSKFFVEWKNGTRVACMCESSWKCALTLHSCISVTDQVKITSIATGRLYLYAEFHAS